METIVFVKEKPAWRMYKIVKALKQEYKPDKIDFLFVAESPPKENSGRFFYLSRHVRT